MAARAMSDLQRWSGRTTPGTSSKRHRPPENPARRRVDDPPSHRLIRRRRGGRGAVPWTWHSNASRRSRRRAASSRRRSSETESFGNPGWARFQRRNDSAEASASELRQASHATVFAKSTERVNEVPGSATGDGLDEWQDEERMVLGTDPRHPPTGGEERPPRANMANGIPLIHALAICTPNVSSRSGALAWQRRRTRSVG